MYLFHRESVRERVNKQSEQQAEGEAEGGSLQINSILIIYHVSFSSSEMGNTFRDCIFFIFISTMFLEQRLEHDRCSVIACSMN